MCFAGYTKWRWRQEKRRELAEFLHDAMFVQMRALLDRAFDKESRGGVSNEWDV
jgi:hypothetical protein